jgi:hypothetical protein
MITRSPIPPCLLALPALLALLIGAGSATAQEKTHLDIGAIHEAHLHANALRLFGVRDPLLQSATGGAAPFRAPGQPATAQVVVAGDLTARYLTRDAADRTDMMALFPPEDPTHLFTCVEGPRQAIGVLPGGATRFNPSVQRIALADGAVRTVLRGMRRCDGIRVTPWGTLLATEEAADGRAYEIAEPLTTLEHTVLNRGTGQIVDAAGAPASRIAQRPALPTLAWEGLTVLPNGVVFGGDELRPGTAGADTDGGAIYKFVPTTLHAGGDIGGTLSLSPLKAGRVYALRVSCFADQAQFGQGCEVGSGGWVEVVAPLARSDADAQGATGYYRPEDLHRDPRFADPNNPQAVRFCWANTGNEAAAHYGEVLCAVDLLPQDPGSVVTVTRFVEGDLEFNSVDNLAFHPVTGHLYVLEDHLHGDIFACLPDGADRDLQSDGCVRLLSVVDASAEPTGFLFHPDGTRAYLSIQHSDDTQMPPVEDYRTDDVLEITGFRLP